MKIMKLYAVMDDKGLIRCVKTGAKVYEDERKAVTQVTRIVNGGGWRAKLNPRVVTLVEEET